MDWNGEDLYLFFVCFLVGGCSLGCLFATRIRVSEREQPQHFRFKAHAPDLARAIHGPIVEDRSK